MYVHIPFCVRKCAYCDFLSAPAGREVQEAYVEQLLREIRGSGSAFGEYEVQSIFFGGGTPGILETDRLCQVLTRLKQEFACAEDAEVTVETNPGTVSEEKLCRYLEAGVNRLSLGLQSMDDRELSLLGRIHTWEQFLDSYGAARKAGFENINIDVMSALPGQTVESFRRTLKKVLALEPAHLSAYSLIIEEGTPFYERYEGHPELLPSEEEERRMYYDTKEMLAAAGYRRYEISNYAKPGYECRHNLGYWDRTEYLGIGLGASSLLHNRRWDFGEEPVALSIQEQMEEYMFLGLRKTEGVSRSRFAGEFGRGLDEVYGNVLRKMYELGLMEETGDLVRLTERGIDVSNMVMCEFLLG